MKSPFKIGKNVTVRLFLCNEPTEETSSLHKDALRKKKKQPETEYSETSKTEK